MSETETETAPDETIAPDEPDAQDATAETDEPDAPDTIAADQEVIDQAQADFSERAIKARDKALEREFKRHEDALARAWQGLWEQFVCCPLCEGDGFLVPRPAGSMEPEQFAAVTAISGQMQAPQLENDSEYDVCSNCAGWGQTNIAGSKREGLSKQCDRCLGLGYVKTTAVTNVVSLPPIPAFPAAPNPAAPVSYGAPGPNDAYGRPAGHPHYGIEPAAVT